MATPVVDLTADLKLQNPTTAEKQIRDFERRVLQNLRFGNGQPLGRLTAKVTEFDKSLEAANARVVAFGASASIIAGVGTAIKEMVTQAIRVEKTLADINVLLGQSTTSLARFSDSLFDIAKNTGQSFDAVAEAAKEFSRQGLSVTETLKRTQDALILTRLSGLDAAKAVETLTASVNSFAKEGLDTTEIINRLANVDARFAVSSKDLADALARAGGSAQDAGVSFNELLSLVTAVQQRTARGGAVIGNAFKSIFTRLQRADTLDQLEDLGVAVRDVSGATLPAVQILGQLASSYDKLSDSQKSFVSELVGGVYQINILKGLFGDLGQTVPEYARALDVANNSTDQAIQRNEELNKTLASLANSAAQNFTKLSASFGKLVFGPSLERLFGQFNEFSDSIDGSGIGEKIGTSILKGIGNALAGPGLIIGGFLGVKLLGNFTKFATEALGNLAGIGKASQRVQEVQVGINGLLREVPGLQDIILAGATSQAQREAAILAILRAQVAAKNQLASITQATAVGLVNSGVSFNPRSGQFRGRNLAMGYVPTSKLSPEAVMNEVKGARQAGYQITPADVRAMTTLIDGEKKTVVYNTKETVIPNFAGGSEPAIIPPNKSLKDLIYGAGGVNIGGFKVGPDEFPIGPHFRRFVEAAGSFGKDYLKLNPKKFANIYFQGASPDSGNAQYGQGQIDIFNATIAAKLRQEGRNSPDRLDFSFGSAAAHEIGHNFYDLDREGFVKQFMKFAPPGTQFPTNVKDARKFLHSVYNGTSPKDINQIYKGREIEESLVYQFPNFLRKGFMNSAGGYIPNKALRFAASGAVNRLDKEGLIQLANALGLNLGAQRMRLMNESELRGRITATVPDDQIQDILAKEDPYQRRQTGFARPYIQGTATPRTVTDVRRAENEAFLANSPTQRFLRAGAAQRSLLGMENVNPSASFLDRGRNPYRPSLTPTEFRAIRSEYGRSSGNYTGAANADRFAALLAGAQTNRGGGPTFGERARTLGSNLFSFNDPRTAEKAGRFGIAGGALAFAGGAIGGLFSNPDNPLSVGNRVGRGLTSAAGSIGIGASIASVGGPAGVVIGGLVAAAGTLKAAFDNLTPSVEDVQQGIAKQVERLNQEEANFSSFFQSNESVKQLNLTGASDTQISSAFRARQEALRNLTPEERRGLGNDFSDRNIARVRESTAAARTQEQATARSLNDIVTAGGANRNSFGLRRVDVSKALGFVGLSPEALERFSETTQRLGPGRDERGLLGPLGGLGAIAAGLSSFGGPNAQQERAIRQSLRQQVNINELSSGTTRSATLGALGAQDRGGLVDAAASAGFSRENVDELITQIGLREARSVISLALTELNDEVKALEGRTETETKSREVSQAIGKSLATNLRRFITSIPDRVRAETIASVRSDFANQRRASTVEFRGNVASALIQGSGDRLSTSGRLDAERAAARDASRATLNNRILEIEDERARENRRVRNSVAGLAANFPLATAQLPDELKQAVLRDTRSAQDSNNPQEALNTLLRLTGRLGGQDIFQSGEGKNSFDSFLKELTDQRSELAQINAGADTQIDELRKSNDLAEKQNDQLTQLQKTMAAFDKFMQDFSPTARLEGRQDFSAIGAGASERLNRIIAQSSDRFLINRNAQIGLPGSGLTATDRQLREQALRRRDEESNATIGRGLIQSFQTGGTLNRAQLDELRRRGTSEQTLSPLERQFEQNRQGIFQVLQEQGFGSIRDAATQEINPFLSQLKSGRLTASGKTINPQVIQQIQAALGNNDFGGLQQIFGSIYGGLNRGGQTEANQLISRFATFQAQNSAVPLRAEFERDRLTGGRDKPLTQKDYDDGVTRIVEAINPKNRNETGTPTASPITVSAPVTVTIQATASATEVFEQFQKNTATAFAQITAQIKQLREFAVSQGAKFVPSVAPAAPTNG